MTIKIEPARKDAPLFVRMTTDERRRLRVAAAEEGVNYGAMIIMLLDARDERKRRAMAAQKHPGHVPA